MTQDPLFNLLIRLSDQENRSLALNGIGHHKDVWDQIDQNFAAMKAKVSNIEANIAPASLIIYRPCLSPFPVVVGAARNLLLGGC